MIFSLASDIGKVRKNNEDFIDSQIIYKDDDTKIGIFALADGMEAIIKVRLQVQWL